MASPKRNREVVSLTPETHLALEKFKEKLKNDYGESFSYSDIIVVGLRLMWDLLFIEKDERIHKMLKNAKEYRLAKRRGEYSDLTLEESTKKLLQDVLPKEDFKHSEKLKKDILREVIKNLILQNIERGQLADVLALIMQYNHLFNEKDFQEIKEKMKEAGMMESKV